MSEESKSSADDADEPVAADEAIQTEDVADDPVLTDEEKEALLDGISSGEVEVHSSRGPAYASVKNFEFGPGSRIVSNSYPRLKNLNHEFARRVAKQIEALLNADTVVTFSHLKTSTYSEFADKSDGLSLVLEFEPKPLTGIALICLHSTLVELLVETFYGGTSDEQSRQKAEFFTPGETNVAMLFCRALIAVKGEVWQPMTEINAEIIRPHLSSGIIDSIDDGDDVIATEFELSVRGKKHSFDIVWPLNTVATLLPLFEGKKRERDAAEDARWERAIRIRVVDSIVNISSDVGKTRMTLREVADLSPGDVFMVSNPRKSTVFASDVAILEGRFGVHDGRHAVETTHWLPPESGPEAVSNSQTKDNK